MLKKNIIIIFFCLFIQSIKLMDSNLYYAEKNYFGISEFVKDLEKNKKLENNDIDEIKRILIDIEIIKKNLKNKYLIEEYERIENI